MNTGFAAGLAAGFASLLAPVVGQPGPDSVRALAAPEARSAVETPAAAGALTGTPATPDLPRVRVDTRLVAPTGRTIPVRAGDNLQKAIDRAQPGDVIKLDPAATFRGSFRLRRKSGDGWITIRSAAPDASLPREGVRMTPAYASALPRIVTTSSDAAIRTEAGAHHYRLLGLEIAVDTNVKNNGGIVRLGASGEDQERLDQVPHHLILDRVYIHGNARYNTKRCVQLNTATSAVIDSYLSECHAKGQEAQGIIGWNGPGPFKIENNFVEGAAQNLMFGGSDPSIPDLVPSDIEIRRNYFTKPSSWKGQWLVKNILELKNAQRVLIEGNVLENVWAAGQAGFAIVIKSVNQNGRCTWCVVRHVTIRQNTVRDAAGGVAMSGTINGGKYRPGEFLNNVLIEDNVFTNIGTRDRSESGRLFQMLSAIWNITIVHNTGYATKATVAPENDPKKNVYIANNLFGPTQFGIKGRDAKPGAETIAKYFPDGTVTSNAILSGNPGNGGNGGGNGKKSGKGPKGPKGSQGLDTNFYPASAQAAGALRGTDGRPVGANTAAVNAATRGVATNR
jgi:hypothetical protein